MVSGSRFEFGPLEYEAALTTRPRRSVMWKEVVVADFKPLLKVFRRSMQCSSNHSRGSNRIPSEYKICLSFHEKCKKFKIRSRAFQHRWESLVKIWESLISHFMNESAQPVRFPGDCAPVNSVTASQSLRNISKLCGTRVR